MWEFDSIVFLLLLIVGAPLGILALVKMLGEPKLALYLVVATAPVTKSLGEGTITSRITISEFAGILFLLCFLAHTLFTRRGRLFRVSHIDISAALLLLVVLLSVGLKFHAYDDPARLVEAVILLYLIVLFFAIEQVVRSDNDIENVLKVWFGVSMIIVVVGLWDSVGYWLFGLPKIFPSKRDPFRPIATFRNPPQLAIYLFTTFFVALSTYFLPQLRRRDRWFLLILMAGALVVMASTSRRSVFIAYLIGLAAVVILRMRQLRKMIIPVGLIALIGGIVIMKTLEADQTLADFFMNRLSVLTPDVLEKKPFLQSQLEGGWKAFTENPIFGIGFGRYPGSEYDLFEFVSELHSAYLQIMAETGLVGLMAYFLFLFTIIKLCYEIAFTFRDPRWAQFSMTLFASFFGFLISYGYNRHLRERYFWILIAVIVAIHRVARARYLAKRAQGVEVASSDSVVQS